MRRDSLLKAHESSVYFELTERIRFMETSVSKIPLSSRIPVRVNDGNANRPSIDVAASAKQEAPGRPDVPP